MSDSAKPKKTQDAPADKLPMTTAEMLAAQETADPLAEHDLFEQGRNLIRLTVVYFNVDLPSELGLDGEVGQPGGAHADLQ